MLGMIDSLRKSMAFADWRLLLSVLLISVANVGQLHASGTVTGEVSNIDGTPVVGARAFLVDTFHAAVTDGIGAFRLSEISPGQYVVFVTRPDLETHVATIRVDNDEPAHLRITLGANRLLEAAIGAFQASLQDNPRGWKR